MKQVWMAESDEDTILFSESCQKHLTFTEILNHVMDRYQNREKLS